MQLSKRIGAALSAGILTFSVAGCAEDDDPDVIVEDDNDVPGDTGSDTDDTDDTDSDDDSDDTESESPEDDTDD